MSQPGVPSLHSFLRTAPAAFLRKQWVASQIMMTATLLSFRAASASSTTVQVSQEGQSHVLRPQDHAQGEAPRREVHRLTPVVLTGIIANCCSPLNTGLTLAGVIGCCVEQVEQW